MSKNLNKIWFLISIFIVAICAVLFASTFATAEEPNATYTASGTIYENGTTTALEGVTVDAFYGTFDIETPDPFWTGNTSADGKFTVENIPEGETISLQFYYATSHPWSSVYAGNRIYIDTPFASNVDLDTLDPRPDLTLHKYIKNVSGTVTEEGTTTGIPNIKIDFYNPCGLASPFVECSVKTDASGSFDLNKADVPGIAENAPYYLVAYYDGPKPGTGDTYDNYISQTINDLIFKGNTPNVVNFALAKITTIQLLDLEQSETTFFEQWKHKVYINGEYIEEGLLGDSNLTVKGYFEFKIVQDCTLELKYWVGSDEYIETFEPVRYKSVEGWIPVYPINNVKAQNWKLWEGSYKSDQINCYQNFEYKWKQKTGYLFLDVNYVEAAPMELTFDNALHGYFHITQTLGDETHTYDTAEPFQHNFFDGSEISVDDENNLVIDSEVGPSNAIQHTVIQEVPVAGAKFVNWKLNDEVFTHNSTPFITKANEDVKIEVVNEAVPVHESAQTGDENGMLIAILIAVVALAIVGLASYFVINKVKKNKMKSKHSKH